MQDIAVSLLPSCALRSCIHETGYTFGERDILLILYRYAPNHAERMTLLARFADTASDEYATHARRLIAWDEERVARFVTPSADFVYELGIKDDPDTPEECILCPNFETAVAAIGRYYEAYAALDIRPEACSSYRVRKRHLLTASSLWPKQAVDECRLNVKGQILFVDDSTSWLGCSEDRNCSDCNLFCPYDDVLYPSFIRTGDVLRYTETYDPGAAVKYGICPYGCDRENGPWESVYLYPLDSEAVRYADVSEDALTQAHEHVPVPLCELIALDDLPREMRTACETFWTKYLETITP